MEKEKKKLRKFRKETKKIAKEIFNENKKQLKEKRPKL